MSSVEGGLEEVIEAEAISRLKRGDLELSKRSFRKCMLILYGSDAGVYVIRLLLSSLVLKKSDPINHVHRQAHFTVFRFIHECVKLKEK